jgi:hypothetical protein
MRSTALLVVVCLSLGGCGGSELFDEQAPVIPISKDRARLADFADDGKPGFKDGEDICAKYGWYEDGECDEFCYKPDNDCFQDGDGALEGEACYSDSDEACGDTAQRKFYCQGLGQGVGTCRQFGSCAAVSDCSAADHHWEHPSFSGRAICEQGSCVWVPENYPEGVWSWTYRELQDVESEHNYTENQILNWQIHHEGARQIRLRFTRIEIDYPNDFLVVYNNEKELTYSGSYDEFWTEAFAGDTINIHLRTDHAVNAWGFKVDWIYVEEQLGPGLCNQNKDCESSEHCHKNQYTGAYGLSYGKCKQDCTGYFNDETDRYIQDDDRTGVNPTLTVSGLSECDQDVYLSLFVEHSYQGDLYVTITRPDGLVVSVHNLTGGATDDLNIQEKLIASGVQSNGTWTLHVSDRKGMVGGHLRRWSLSFEMPDE